MNCFSNIARHCYRCLQAMLLLVCLLAGQQAMAGTPHAVENNHPLTMAPPNWSIDPLDFEFNMNLVVRVQFEGVTNNNTSNMVAAFVGNELRGVATPTIIGGQAYYFLTAYSNEYVGETVHFRVYYAPNDLVYATLATETFLHNKSVGTTANPFIVNINPNLNFPPELLPILADTTVQGVPFDPITLANYLVSADGDPVTWITQPGPNLTASVVNGILTVTPVSGAWTGTDSVRIIVRETTPGMLSDTITGWFTVLADYGLPVWQDIPDQTIFKGGAFAPFDLDDYLTFGGDCHGFDYDVFPFTGTAVDPAWPAVVPGAQPMNIVARALFADVQLAGAGTKLAAFVNGTLAGWATPTGVAPNVTYSLSLKNVGAGPITFRLYDATHQYLYEKITTLVFAAGGSAGTVASPYLIQYSPLLPSLAANGAFDIQVIDMSWTGSYPVNFIVWDCHFPTTRRDTTQAIFSIVDDTRPQINSPATVNTEENSCGSLYDTQAIDPNDSEGAGLTYSLAGGADAAKFTIDAQTGILNWISGFSPDFENPADANADNHYQVNIRVVNTANLSDTLALTVIVTNVVTEPFAAVINGGVALNCTNATVTLQATGGVSYVWSTGSIQSAISVNSAGTYTVTVTSSGSCTATASAVVAPPVAISASGSAAPICAGSSIELKATPSAGTPPYATFAWTGPNNYTASVEDPAGFPATAAAAGVYRVTVTDAKGCTATASTTITVSGNSAPAITAANNGPVCVGTNLNLSSVPSGGSGVFNQFSWSGPNNYTSIAQNPAAFPATATSGGNYTVTVTDNAGCSATGSTTVTVKPAPSITASSNSPACTGGTILLNSTPSGGSGTFSSFAWAGPNNFSASIEDPAGFPAVAAAAGTYTVTVTDNAGCVRTATTVVAVTGLPAITATLLSPVCTGGTVALGSTPAGGSGIYTGFAWTGPNNFTSTLQNPAPFAVSAAAAGTYTVVVTDQSGCTASNTVTVTIHSLPAITAANNGPVCQGQNLTLSSTPSAGSGTYSAFAWTGPDNYVAGSEDPAAFSTTASSAGIYQVKVTDSNGCTATATTTAVVKLKPTITATSNAPLCTNGILHLQSTPGSGSGSYTFIWSGPASYSSTLEDPAGFAVTLANAGIYQVSVTDSGGCTATATTSVSISTSNAPTISATSNSPICGGTNLTLLSTPTGGSGIYSSFQWAGPNSYAAAQQNPTPFAVFSSGAGVYTVTVTDSKSCKATATATVVVNGPGVAPTSNSPVCPGSNIILQVNATGGVSFAWAGPNNYSSNQANPPAFPGTPAAAGTYTVTVTDAAGCKNTGSVTVVFGDITPPVIVCPANATVAANASCSAPIGTFTVASVSDNCAANPAVTQSPAASTVLNGHNSTQTVTLTANDGNGNTATCTFTVTLKDVTKPVIVCPANTTVAASATCAGVVGSHSPVSVSDNCAANPAVTQSPVASTALSGHNDVETVTLTANDGNGNTESCTFTVTLKDVTKPVIVCPANTTLAADATCSHLLGSYAAVSVSDNCNPDPTVTQSPVASTVLNGHNDVETVTLTANDGNGNTELCTFTVTLKDITKPVIVCPANATVSADATCSGVVGTRTAASVSDNCNPNPVVTQSPVASTVLSGHNDVETVTLTADDGNGNIESCTFTVTLKDVTKPVIVCPANATVSADASCAGVVGTYSPVSVSDNCNPNPTVTQSPFASTVLSGHNDVETVTLTANDGNGNTEICTFTVTLKDVTKPVIVCPANTTLAADATCSHALGSYNAVSVSDNCNPNPTVTQSPAASTILNGHDDVEIVTLTANDGNGNTEICTFTVTLKDITKPVIVCPANTTLAADATCSHALGSYNAVSVSDNCNPNPAVTQSPAASTILNGHNDVETVTLTANDGNGNTEFCTFTVTLKDITAPVVVCKPFTAALNAAGTTSITTGDVFQSGSDNCGVVNQVSVIPNTFTCANLGANTVVLTVNDGNGNTSSCNAVVTVVDLIPPTMLCKPLTLYLNAAGATSVTAPQLNNGSFDNCTLVSVTAAPTSFTCANIGNNIVTLTGTDQSGNTATCQSTVTVLDTIRPTMICQNATINLNAAGQATLTVAQINNGSFDNCSIISMTLSQTAFNCSHLGNNTVKLVGTDQSGNTNFCSATVTVQDLIAPVARCKDITANLNASGTVTVLPSAVDNVSTDNCSFTLSLTPSTFTCSNLGINLVTLRATDVSGNSSTCTARVTVKDVTPPVTKCKNITVSLSAQGKVTITASQIDNGSTDNCTISTMTATHTMFNCSDIGAPVNNILTVTDNSGNSATCLALVTVKDVTPPTAVCTNTTVTLGSNGTATVYGSVLAATSYDNCSVFEYLPTAKVYTTANVGNNNLLITVKDFSGNAATCTSVVTVLSNKPDNGKDNLHMQISPNPSAGDVVLKFVLPEAQEYDLQAFDLSGRATIIQKNMGVAGENTVILQRNSFSIGVHTIRVMSEGVSSSKRLIIRE